MRDMQTVLAALILLLGLVMLAQMVSQGKRIIRPKPVQQMESMDGTENNN